VSLFEAAFSSLTCALFRIHVISKEEDGGLKPTQFGRAIVGSSLDMTHALRIYKDLENGMKSLCIDTEIHMLFLVCLSSSILSLFVTQANRFR